MTTLRTYDYQKILDTVKDWNIVKEEKIGLKSYAEKRLGEMIESEASNPEGSIEAELINLHQVLEYCCSKKSAEELTTEVEDFKIGLTTGKIQKKIRKKDKKTGEYIFVDGGSHKDFRKLRVFSTYLKYRLQLPSKYAFSEEKDISDNERLKQRKLIHFISILRVQKKQRKKDRKKIEKKKHKLTEDKINLIKQNLNTDWKRDYFYLVSRKGPRFGEIMQVELEDFNIKGPLTKITLKEEHSKTYGGEDLPIFNKEASDYLKKRITERRANGEAPNNKFIKVKGKSIEKDASAVKSWNRRLGIKLFGFAIRNKDYRDFAAADVVNKGTIRDRYRLCRWMSWELNSPMADEYIDKKEIDLENTEVEHLEKEKIDLSAKISKLEEKHAIELEELQKQREQDKIKNIERDKDFAQHSMEILGLKEKMGDIGSFGDVADNLLEDKNLQKAFLQSMIKNGLGKQLMEIAGK